MKKLLVLILIFTLSFVSKSEAKPSDFSVVITFGASPFCTGYGICRIDILLKTASNAGDSGSEILDAKGEIQNNMLVINLAKEINEKGKNAQGKYIIPIPKEMTADQDLAKELGLEKLVIAPGNYEMRGNTLALKIVSPRDISTGQSSGKRLLPTVNKKNIAIDESGVHKTSTPTGEGSSRTK